MGTINYIDATDFQIGWTPQSVVPLRRMGVPIPDQVVYRSASKFYVRADHKRVGDGFPSADWVWDVISISKLNNLLQFLQGEDSYPVYIVTQRRDGTYPNPKNSLAMFYCIMWKPLLSGQEGTHVARAQHSVQTVKVTFVKLVEQSGYL